MKNKMLRVWFEQKAIGILLLLVSVVLIWAAASGNTVCERDITPCFLTIPAGIYLLFASKVVE